MKLVPPVRSAKGQAASAVGNEATCYDLYGLAVRSEIELPLRESPNRNRPVDCDFLWSQEGTSEPKLVGEPMAGLRCYDACHNGRYVTSVFRNDGDGTFFCYDSVGTCHVSADSRRVTVYPRPNYDEKSLRMLLTGQIAAFVLHQQGIPSLHASAVAVDGQGVVFLGDPGHGKTTLAGAFLNAGYRLIADDVLPLRNIRDVMHGGPSIPLMKLAPLTARQMHLDPEGLPRVGAWSQKHLLDVSSRMGSWSVPIRAVYLLNRYDAEMTRETKTFITPLKPTEGVIGLLRHTSNRAYLKPNENTILPVTLGALARQSRVSVLRYPSGFEHQESVMCRIIQDLAGR